MKNETTFVKIGGSGYVRLPTNYIKWFELKPNEIIYLEDKDLQPTGKSITLTKGTGKLKERRRKRDTQPKNEQKIGQTETEEPVLVVNSMTGEPMTITDNST